MQTVNVSGTTLLVSDSGPRDGRVVMFGNSLGTDHRVWDALLPHLPGDLRIVRYDKRGHGLSDCPDAPYAMETLVDDAAAIADALRLRDITFVGLSIGGLIGQGLAQRRPDLLRALVLMDTAAKIGTAEMWRERIAMVRDVGLPGMAEAVLDRWFAPALRRNAVALAPWRNMLVRTPAEGYAGCCAAIAGADFSRETAALTIPVMAMVGAADGATPPALVQATADLCRAPCHVIDDAGHLPCVEQPAAVAALLKDFLERTE